MSLISLILWMVAFFFNPTKVGYYQLDMDKPSPGGLVRPGPAPGVPAPDSPRGASPPPSSSAGDGHSAAQHGAGDPKK